MTAVTMVEMIKGEIWRYSGNTASWAGMPDKVGTLLVADSSQTFTRLTISILKDMVRDGTFVKVAEADGTPVEPYVDVDDGWVEKERLRLGIPDVQEIPDEDGTFRLQIDTFNDDYVAIKSVSVVENPLELIGGDLGHGDLDKLIIALLYVRDHLKKAGYDC